MIQGWRPNGALALGQMLALLALLAFPRLGSAQQLEWETTFGQNPINQTGQIRWHRIATPRFDIVYQLPHRELALNTVWTCEQAWQEVITELDYAPEGRIMIHVYPSQTAYQSALVDPDAMPGETFHVQATEVVFPGSFHDFYPHVRAQLYKLALHDMYFGGGGTRPIQNRASLYLPQWYYDGFAEYMGEGWTPEDEQVLHGLQGKNPLVVVLNEKHTRQAPSVRKSFWHYLRERFGPKKLSEVAYLVKLTHALEGGLIAVLGLSSMEATRYWRDYVELMGRLPRSNPDETSEQLQLAPGDDQEVLAVALADNARDLAAVVSRKGRVSLELLNLSTGEQATLPIKWGRRTHHPAWRHEHSALSWAPDGKQLVVFQPDAKSPRLHYYTPSRAEIKSVALPQLFTEVQHMAYSPDGKQLAISGVQGGQVDLLVTRPLSEGFRRLTRDRYDDLDVAWTADGAGLFFVSNRDTALGTRYREVPRAFFHTSLDLYRYDLEAGAIQRLSYTPFENERYPFAPADQELLVQTDEYGLPTLGRFTGGTVEPLYDYQAGMLPLSYAANGVVFRSEARARTRYYYIKLAGWATRDAVQAQKTGSKVRWYKRKLQAAMAAEQARQDSLAAALGQADPTDEPVEPAADSAEATDNGLRFYVFDEPPEATPDERQERRQIRREDKRALEARRKTKPFDLEAIRVTAANPLKPTIMLRRQDGSFGFDPFYGFWFGTGLELSDPANFHHFRGDIRVFEDLRSTDIKGQYRFRGLSYVHLGADFQRQARYFQDNGYYKFRTDQFSLYAAHPISRFQRVELQLGYQHIRREELLFDEVLEEFEGSRTLLQPTLRYVWDNARRTEDFWRKGFKVSVAARPTYVMEDARWAFTNLTADVRKYTEVLQSIVIATRLSGGWSTGPDEQLFMLGGVNNWWFDSFDSPNDIPVEGNIYDLNWTSVAAPLRGVNFNARNGSKYVLASAELRVPLKRLFPQQLPTSKRYTTNVVFFYDVGTAWTTGSPFSQRNPVNFQTIVAPPVFEVDVQSLKSPFIQGVGAGFMGTIFGLTGRADLAWAIEDGEVLDPILTLALGYSF